MDYELYDVDELTGAFRHLDADDLAALAEAFTRRMVNAFEADSPYFHLYRILGVAAVDALNGK